MSKSKIEWTGRTWNVVTGHEDVLNKPYLVKKPSMFFVNSMSDLFHKDMPFDTIKRIFKVMNDCNWHTFQVLTKRADIMEQYVNKLKVNDNIWLGVSIENEKALWRIKHLQRTNGAIKFLSLEPLLGALPNLDLRFINWVIVGGESGVKARPMKKEWVIDIRDKCKEKEVAFFFKQWGGINKKKADRLLDGLLYNEMPSLIKPYNEDKIEALIKEGTEAWNGINIEEFLKEYRTDI